MLGAFAISVLLAAFGAEAKQNHMSDDQVAKQIIAESIASYPGPCACPFNTTRNGSSCGRRSAYSKPGGYSPICYREDVTDEDIAEYKQRMLKK
ncbi:hypothetical protein HU760_015200 [Pseudomonas sp. RD9SR1]|uniref:Uncharacterized protein n=1 Tax=Pseudomonas oryzicola TaxID=485876 RepID=A0ABS6QCL3_9PSED|nr:hypothetical protein [Pseudomonas oryzicola]